MIYWTEEQQKLLQELEYDFHVRAFGEEMAAINFMPAQERLRSLSAMWEFARKNGVPRCRAQSQELSL